MVLILKQNRIITSDSTCTLKVNVNSLFCSEKLAGHVSFDLCTYDNSNCGISVVACGNVNPCVLNMKHSRAISLIINPWFVEILKHCIIIKKNMHTIESYRAERNLEGNGI